ncbi:hypothetical protein ScPMuIL_000753 [Solemya velum]
MSKTGSEAVPAPVFIEGYRLLTNGEQSMAPALPVAMPPGQAVSGLPSFALQIQNVQTLVPPISPPLDKQPPTTATMSCAQQPSFRIKQEPVDTGYDRASHVSQPIIAARPVPIQTTTTALPAIAPAISTTGGESRPQFITFNLPGSGQIQGQLINQNIAGINTPNIIIAHPPNAVATNLNVGGNNRIKPSQTVVQNPVRNVLRTMLDNKTKDVSMKNVIEELLQKNENLLANNEADTFKPNKRMSRAKDKNGDEILSKSFPMDEPVVFNVNPGTSAKINPTTTTNKPTKETFEKQSMTVLRPKSPTKHCKIPKEDMWHISHAVVDLPIMDEEAESIFKVQLHEMVCAVGSKVLLMTPKGESLNMDLTCYWCNFCPFKTERKDLLVQHIIDHRFHCKFCSYQSFSRADVIHHAVNTHSSFRETAKMLKYCAFLPDYLQVGLMQKAGSKRKKDTEQGDEKPNNKRFKLDENQMDGVHTSDKTPKDKSSTNTQFFNMADYDVFQMEISEIAKSAPVSTQSVQSLMVPLGQASKPKQPTNIATASTNSAKTLPISVASLTRSPKKLSTTFRTGGISLIKKGIPLVGQDLTCSAETQTQAEEDDLNGSPPRVVDDESDSAEDTAFSIMKKRLSREAKFMRAPANIMSGLSWRCGNCSFASLNQSVLKTHARTKHNGKSPRFIAILVSGQEEYDQIKASDLKLTTMQPEDYPVSKVPPVLDSVGKKYTTHLVCKKKTAFPTSLPIPPISTKDFVNAQKNPLVFDCPHCDYTNSSALKVKDHLFFNHPGVTFYALDMRAVRMKQRRYVLFCHRGSCSFFSKDAEAYLNHVVTCIPSTKDEGELSKQTRELTRTFARKNSGKVSRTSSITGKLNKPEFGCMYCSFVSNLMVKIRKHVLSAHPGKDTVIRDVRAHKLRKRQHIFFCKLCMYQGKSQIERNIHLQRFHKGDKSKKPTELSEETVPSPVSVSISDDEEVEYSDCDIPEEEVHRMMNDYVTEEAMSQQFTGRPTREAAAKAQVKCRTQGHNPPIYRCLRCGVMFFGMSLMRKHMRSMHPKSVLTAIDVGKKKVHKKPYVYFCPQNGCSFCNSTAEAVITHALEHGLTPEDEDLSLLRNSSIAKSPSRATNQHIFKEEDSETDSPAEINYKCSSCEEITLSLEMMKRHYEECHAGREIKYTDCSDENIRSDASFESVPPEGYLCAHKGCMFTTEKENIFRLHSLAHDHSKVYECSECQHYAATKDDMRTHVTEDHTGQAVSTMEIDVILDSTGAIIQNVGLNSTLFPIKEEQLDE